MANLEKEADKAAERFYPITRDCNNAHHNKMMRKRTSFKKGYILGRGDGYKLLIGFLEWMNKTTTDNPMAIETDNDDIVAMFLNKTYE